MIPGKTYYRATWRDFFNLCQFRCDFTQEIDTIWRVSIIEDFLYPNIQWETDQYSVTLLFNSPLSGLMKFGRPNKQHIRDKQLLLCDLLQHFGFYETAWYEAITTLHDVRDLKLMLKFIAPFFGFVGIDINDERIVRAKTINAPSFPYQDWPDNNYDIPYLVRRDRAEKDNCLLFIEEF